MRAKSARSTKSTKNAKSAKNAKHPDSQDSQDSTSKRNENEVTEEERTEGSEGRERAGSSFFTDKEFPPSASASASRRTSGRSLRAEVEIRVISARWKSSDSEANAWHLG